MLYLILSFLSGVQIPPVAMMARVPTQPLLPIDDPLLDKLGRSRLHTRHIFNS